MYSVFTIKQSNKTLEKRQGLGYNIHMVISWFGLSSFKISSGDFSLVTDPFSKTVGLSAPRGQTDVAIVSNAAAEAYNNTESLGGAFVVDGPGEYDIKGITVRGIAASGDVGTIKDGVDHTTIYAIRMEDIRLGFLGSLKQKQLTDQQLEDLGEVDILFVPVGGKVVCDAEEAVTIVNQLEPRIVIPMHFAQSGLAISLEKADQFLKEMGVSAKVAPQDKLTIKKSAFTEETKTEIIVLVPLR